MADCVDPASDIVTVLIGSMKRAFDPASSCPPLVGESTDVRFFAGDAAPMAAWDAHAAGYGCEHPFLWVRSMRRYRSADFPNPTVDRSPCSLPRVVALEVGVARCAVVDMEPSWHDYGREAEISLDDSWRIETALCDMSKRLGREHYQVGTEDIAPYGPEGGIIAWTGTVYVGY